MRRAALTSPRLRGEVAALFARRVRGYRSLGEHRLAERAPHPSPLRASFACLDPVKNGEREKKQPRI
jgi:DNA helicase II / ATP-dependent DNA helicase PcrA